MLQNTKRNSYNDSVALKDALRRCNFAEISLIVDCLYWAVQRDVKVLEARNRLGGRIESVDMGPYKVDMGASWIHGIGLGCGDIEEWLEKENPIYTIAKENGIETVPTWNDEGDANTKYYWHQQQS